MSDWRDLGHDHRYSLTVWSPDRDLNPQYADVSDIDPCGAIVEHLTPAGEPCKSHIYFDVPGVDAITTEAHRWQVQSLDPLTVSPSLLCRRCGDHGWVTNGAWIPA